MLETTAGITRSEGVVLSFVLVAGAGLVVLALWNVWRLQVSTPEPAAESASRALERQLMKPVILSDKPVRPSGDAADAPPPSRAGEPPEMGWDLARATPIRTGDSLGVQSLGAGVHLGGGALGAAVSTAQGTVTIPRVRLAPANSGIAPPPTGITAPIP